ncbi:MAG: hypothetical protein N2561_01455 [Bacteroidetes bacterium]|nr:hypothetical protein [Rhodothermia bacterium]MCS7155184.1 hypothetical protein [Bacteroidota bacterium]MCX7906189.1 hypothetical protein [Bacteroidota bacterium]MDW8138316.1 hypothetical protein [Bacteroidota bacterium]MDW8286001.1 hypothetical protein [Bacteroidota bacterium]
MGSSTATADVAEAQQSGFRILQVQERRDWLRFIAFPYRLYRREPNWVPPLWIEQRRLLDPARNPFFEHSQIALFLAERDGHVIGRIAAIRNGNHLAVHQDGTGFFGFFEVIPDYEVAAALLERAAQWLRDRELLLMRGPVNPSLNDTAGVLLEGFEHPPALLMPYNPPYYAEFLERFGLRKVMGMYAYYVDVQTVQTDKLERGVELVHRRLPDLRVRKVNLKDFEREARTVRDIYNEAWRENWGFVPMTEREFAHLAQGLRAVVDPHIVFIAELQGQPVGFSVSLPNLNEALRHVRNGRLFPCGLVTLLWHTRVRKIRGIRTIIMGVLPAYRGRGIDAVMHYHTIREGMRRGYRYAELSWVLETNEMMHRAARMVGAVPYKRYALYEMPV